MRQNWRGFGRAYPLAFDFRLLAGSTPREARLGNRVTSLCVRRFFVLSLSLVSLLTATSIADEKPIVLVDSDHRTSISLNGDWHAIVDPYDNGYVDFRMKVRADGYFLNEKPDSSQKLVEYDFSKSATLRVPGDWNSQRDSLFFYEGTIWYEKDFQYQPKPQTRAPFSTSARRTMSPRSG